jgi:hypothetical protein
MNGIPAEPDNAPAAVPVEQPKQPKKPRVAAHAADAARSKARSGHRATRAKTASKGTTSAKSRKKEASVRPGSKAAKVLDPLKRSGGASLKELMKATGWQAHSVRGFLSGALGKMMGLTVSSAKAGEDRRYSVNG